MGDSMVNRHDRDKWEPIDFKSDSIEYLDGMHLGNFKIAYIVFVHTFYDGDIPQTAKALGIRKRWLFERLSQAEDIGYEVIRRGDNWQSPW